MPINSRNHKIEKKRKKEKKKEGLDTNIEKSG
jgi:hypothetical protein